MRAVIDDKFGYPR